jgi:hypothetical protein
MRLALGKVPDIPEPELGHLVSPVLVDGGDKNAAEEDLAPFSLISIVNYISSWKWEVCRYIPRGASAVRE